MAKENKQTINSNATEMPSVQTENPLKETLTTSFLFFSLFFFFNFLVILIQNKYIDKLLETEKDLKVFLLCWSFA